MWTRLVWFGVRLPLAFLVGAIGILSAVAVISGIAYRTFTPDRLLMAVGALVAFSGLWPEPEHRAELRSGWAKHGEQSTPFAVIPSLSASLVVVTIISIGAGLAFATAQDELAIVQAENEELEPERAQRILHAETSRVLARLLCLSTEDQSLSCDTRWLQLAREEAVRNVVITP